MTDQLSVSDVKELRLGLVCYGGVSLAIYMHGVIKEIHNLMLASRAYEERPDGENPFPGGCRAAYWDAIRSAHRDSGVRTRVVVDIISGTSAGGINGVILAKALAHNLSQESLTDLWFTRGDIEALAGGGKWTLVRKGLGIVAGLVLKKKRAKPPLKGNEMLRWIYEALVQMDRDARPTEALEDLPELQAAPTLMPQGSPLDLFVTTTDFYGYTRQVVIADPRAVEEKRHRHMLPFRFDGSVDQFDAGHNDILALAARSTSSFPGAFPPVALSDLTEAVGTTPARLDEIAREFYSHYELCGQNARDTHFVDGGVLDNKPFLHAIRAIAERPAAVEVDRRLIYIEPDPNYEPADPAGTEPALIKTIWGGLSSIAGYEPILDDILEVEDFNRQVERVNQIVADCRKDVLALLQEVEGFNPDLPIAEIAKLRLAIQQKAKEKFGVAQKSHFLLRIHSVVDQFAHVICRRRKFPDGHNAATYVRCVVRHWAEKRGLVGENADPALQEDFLDIFDLGYTRRRILFVIQGVNRLYARLPLPGDARPVRSDLDEAKKALYAELAAMISMIGGASLPDGTLGQLEAIFPRPRFDFQRQSIDEMAREFVGDPVTFDSLSRLEGALTAHLRVERQRVRAKLFEQFHGLTRAWSSEQRTEILVRYLGFPFWDSLIYPIQALSKAGELNRIEVMRISPEDARVIPVHGSNRTRAKLKGIGVHHFAAFFKREFRENDYLWGRLDSAERLVGLLLGKERPGGGDVKPVLEAILGEEEARPLATIPDGLKELRGKVAALADG